MDYNKDYKMNGEKIKGIIEAILFASSRNVKMRELMSILDLDADTINKVILNMQKEYENENRGIQIIRVDDGFELASKKEYYEYLYPILDKRVKMQLSSAAMEVLTIVAYNNRITKADIDTIRGADSSGTIYKLQDYGLIEQAGKADLPGKPMTYKTTDEFLKMFNMKSLKELPELPRFKLDSNRQIVIDDIQSVDENNDDVINENNVNKINDDCNKEESEDINNSKDKNKIDNENNFANKGENKQTNESFDNEERVNKTNN